MKGTQNQDGGFGEFARAYDLVEEYFDETLDDVALHTPVSRRQLVTALTRVQLSGRALADEALTQRGEIVYQSDDETLYWLESGVWGYMRGHLGLTPDEVRAAREVHRRLIEILDDAPTDDDHGREPFVCIDRAEPYRTD
ncbi:hypothetical protein RBH26_00275 [Natronolimnohabitans sp. A-GB9]|uniref:hypothetical protein n=1 Tax=Natronolimnohabitans sp. A-GB9 TaxID=3069757 RepID=UPI0027B2AAC2|nr:hypothetical protein [Natronolimnohabitans sp. A-GB9]MDQ2048913.1 hypothetical protein [Natronolimnohabitans sp. A-GB9]